MYLHLCSHDLSSRLAGWELRHLVYEEGRCLDSLQESATWSPELLIHTHLQQQCGVAADLGLLSQVSDQSYVRMSAMTVLPSIVVAIDSRSEADHADWTGQGAGLHILIKGDVGQVLEAQCDPSGRMRQPRRTCYHHVAVCQAMPGHFHFLHTCLPTNRTKGFPQPVLQGTTAAVQTCTATCLPAGTLHN